MNSVLDQVFYGRGDRGYTILGASPGGAEFAARVESLCGSVGTPGSEYGGEPFLLSVPENDCVIMVCGRRGAPDAMGRATLFFHALIAAKQDLVAAKADAFSLFEQGVFGDRIPSGEIVPLRLDLGLNSRGSAERHLDVVLPCLFRAEGPAPERVRSAVGDRVNDLAWATYSFQPLPDFDVQVLPLRVLAPWTINEYDASGKRMRAACAKGEAREAARRDPERQSPLPAAPVTKAPPPGKSNAMLKFSLVLNLALAAACAALLALRKPASVTSGQRPEQRVVTNVVEKIVEKRVAAPLSGERKAEIVREEVKRLKGKFHLFRIEDFDGEAKGAIKNYELQGLDPKYDKQREFLEKLRAYVNFVNELQEKQNHE